MDRVGKNGEIVSVIVSFK